MYPTYPAERPSTAVTATTQDRSPLESVLARVWAQPRAGHPMSASAAFLTTQGARHGGRRNGYLNTVLSVRIGAAVGSCAVEPAQLEERIVRDLPGSSVSELLSHSEQAVRLATLDAYLADRLAHRDHPRANGVRIPPGDSLSRSMARARAVVSLVPQAGPVAVIGVVNSLLATLRERGLGYRPCDLKGGRTEWDERILTEHAAAIDGSAAVLASGMVLGNGTFDDIAAMCRSAGIPLVMFAQTGAAVLRELLGSDLHALSAEPYPFFWLTGDESVIYTYRAEPGDPA